MPVDATPAASPHIDIVFDPHVALALLLMVVALAIVFVMTLIPVEENRRGRR
jgi:hypothetical protein